MFALQTYFAGHSVELSQMRSNSVRVAHAIGIARQRVELHVDHRLVVILRQDTLFSIVCLSTLLDDEALVVLFAFAHHLLDRLLHHLLLLVPFLQVILVELNVAHLGVASEHL